MSLLLLFNPGQALAPAGPPVLLETSGAASALGFRLAGAEALSTAGRGRAGTTDGAARDATSSRGAGVTGDLASSGSKGTIEVQGGSR